MDKKIKSELHNLIDNCDNELLLTEAKALLESNKEIKDWWDELTDEDKSVVMQSETEYERRNFVSHNELMQQFETWKKK